MQQDLIGPSEHFDHGGILGGDAAQTVIGDRDGGVGHIFQSLEAFLRLSGPFAAFERKRLAHNGHREGAKVFADPGDDRCRTGSGSASQAGGYEHHVAVLEELADLLFALDGRLTPDFGVGAGPQTFGEFFTQLDLDRGIGGLEGLCIGIGGDEFNTLELAGNHVVDGVSAGSPDTDDLDFCRFFIVNESKHVSPPV